MPDTISPVTREEDYLAAIAGQDVTPPTPVTRKEEWLDLIAGKVDDLAGDIEDLQDVVPAPEAADSGKVLTAGADGTASWQTASGGGDCLLVKATGVCTYIVNPDDMNSQTWVVGVDKTSAQITAAFTTDIKPVYVVYPSFSPDSPYYSYEDEYGCVTSLMLNLSGMTTASLIPDPQYTFYEDNGAWYMTVYQGGSN